MPAAKVKARPRGANVTPGRSASKQQWSHPAGLLKAETVIVTCGLTNFETSTYSSLQSKEWITSHGHKPIQPGLLTNGHLNYDGESRKGFLCSFRANYWELCEGRKITVIDCTVIKNPDYDKRLCYHLGTHPQTWSQVLKHQNFRTSHVELAKLTSTEKNLVICVCKSGCHRSLVSSYSIAPVIKARLYGGDPKDACVKTSNLQDHHHSVYKCNMCSLCKPDQDGNKSNLRRAHELLSSIIGKPEVTERKKTRHILSPVTVRDRKSSGSEAPQPTSTGSRDAPVATWHRPASGGIHPTSQPPPALPWHTKYASGGEHPTRKRQRSNDQQEGKVHLTLAFNDSVIYGSMYRNDMIPDPRPSIKLDEAVHYTAGAHVVIKPTQFDVRGLQWKVTSNGPEWSVDTRNRTTPLPILPMINIANSYTVKRMVSGDPREVHVITVRIIKGKSAHIDIHFDPNRRQSVVFALLDMLIEAPRPAIVIGNFGIALNGMVSILENYKGLHSDSAATRIQMINSRDQQLFCLTLDAPGRSSKWLQVDYTLCPERMFVVQLCDDNAVLTDDLSEHPATSPTEPARKKTKVISEPPTQASAPRNVARLSTPSLEPLRRRHRAEPGQKKTKVISEHPTQAAAPWNVTASSCDSTAARLHTPSLTPLRRRPWAQPNGGYPQISDDARLAGNNRPPPYNRARKFMDMLWNMEARAEEDSRMQWIMYLYTVRSTTSSRDGTQFCGAIDIKQTLQRLDGALSIIQNARKQALRRTGQEATTTDATQHNVTLTKAQMTKAYEWLRFECFEAKYMHNMQLKARIARREANHQSLTPTQFQKLKDDRRGAFKAWKFNLLGNAALFNTVLSCGIFEAGDQRRFLLAYEEQLEEKPERYFSKDEKEQRRINAKQARRTLREAMELSAKVHKQTAEHMDKRIHTMRPNSSCLQAISTPSHRPVKSEAEEQLLTALDAGHLDSECKDTARLVQEANSAHHYISMREAALFRMSTIEMEENLTGWQPHGEHNSEW